jgi:hypothetical protein
VTHAQYPPLEEAGNRAGQRAEIVVVRGGVEPPTFRFSGGRSYQLSYLTAPEPLAAERRSSRPSRAVLTGLEPATSTLTGWRANRLLYRTLLLTELVSGAPNGIRTRAAALKGRCPRPLDDGGRTAFAAVTLGARRRGLPQHRGQLACPAKRNQAPRPCPRGSLPDCPPHPGTAGQHSGHRVGRCGANAKTIMAEPLAQLLIFRHGRHSTNNVGSLLPVTGHLWASRDQLQRVRCQLHCARRHRKAETA